MIRVWLSVHKRTQGSGAVHGLYVHESGQVWADGDAVFSRVFICSVYTSALPVRPVHVSSQQRQTVRMLYRRHQRPAV